MNEVLMGKKCKFFILLASFAVVSFIFNKYAYEIQEFNAMVRIFLITGNFVPERTFRDGIPISHSPRIGDYISPFYVIHYGLVYSNTLCSLKKIHNNVLCKTDSSLKYWNVPIEVHNEKEASLLFKNTLEWLSKNVSYVNGKAHFIYNFDWPYKNYVNGKVTAPWWSGLTDAYAIILLLRGYDYFKEEKYLKLAKELYQSVLSLVETGGDLNNVLVPWIEEYIDPKVEPKFYPHVLNGMIYAYKGIETYEDFVKADRRVGRMLFESILKLLPRFSNGNHWSYYDLIGSSANIKYHKIHVALLKDILNKIEQHSEFKELYYTKLLKIYKSWKLGAENAGLFYILNGPRSTAYYHFIISFSICWLGLYFLLLKMYTIILRMKKNG